MSAIGSILEKDRAVQDDYNYKVVAECGDLWAIQPIEDRIYRSYAPVISGLSLNPDLIPIVEPVQWYVKDEILTVFRIKQEKKQ